MIAPEKRPLRAITYLAPGIPLEFFECITARLARALGREVTLVSDDRRSGPMHGDHDPFSLAAEVSPGGERAGGARAEGAADLGFLCSPSYLYLASLPAPSAELVPAGFVFADVRNGGRPLYFSDVIVRADRGAARLEDLAGGIFGFNDTCSLSGYFAAHRELARRALGAGDAPGGENRFFSEERCTGSHEASIEAVLAGDVDVAATDSNVLALARRVRPELSGRLRVVESWGPHPIQPVVLGARCAPECGPVLRTELAAALLALGDDRGASETLARFGLIGCVPVDERHCDEERAVLERLGELPPRCG